MSVPDCRMTSRPSRGPAVCMAAVLAVLWLPSNAPPAAQAAAGAGAAATTVPLPDAGRVVRIRARCGKLNASLTLGSGKGRRKDVQLSISCVDMMNRNHHWGMGRVPKDLKDAGLLLRMFAPVGGKRVNGFYGFGVVNALRAVQ